MHVKKDSMHESQPVPATSDVYLPAPCPTLCADIVARVSESYCFNGENLALQLYGQLESVDYQHVILIHVDIAQHKKRKWMEMESLAAGNDDLMEIADEDAEKDGAATQNLNEVEVFALFEERPVWTRDSIVQRLCDKGLKCTHHMLNRFLLRAAYYFLEELRSTMSPGSPLNESGFLSSPSNGSAEHSATDASIHDSESGGEENGLSDDVVEFERGFSNAQGEDDFGRRVPRGVKVLDTGLCDRVVLGPQDDMKSSFVMKSIDGYADQDWSGIRILIPEENERLWLPLEGFMCL
ncbi:hypothetical protein AALP_AA8G423100 [Arabis alpina]|uniref:Transcription factor IIIC subunit 5 HTH domain-containing protein n=1 Tax=Arabis alpina TaxID=50452 RepID=A0A087GCY7_ARAAL|nr:hypothetical protein AALP_AA8G423100 [Arabis alpina]